MSLIKCYLAVLFYFQLSTTVLGGPNITQNAENALTILYGQCQSSANLISITSGNLWNTYATDIAREVDDYVTKDHAKIKLVVNKLINIANVTVNGETCISEIKGLLNSTNYTLDVTSRERATFSNLRNLALVEISNLHSQYFDLNSEFVTNCVRNRTNCEGTSKGIIAEVERLLPRARRVPYELFIDTHILGYKLEVNLRNLITYILQDTNKAIENSALCLASTINNWYSQVRTRRNFDLPPQNESILNLYENLLAVTKNATESSTKNIIAHLSNIVDQCSTEYNNNTIRDIDNAISRANTTINSIISTSQENLTINITTLCTIPDLKAISEKLKRDSFNEINEVIMYGLDSIYRRTIGNINFTRNEVLSVGLQIEECTSITDCYYFTQKMNTQKTLIPWVIGKIENSTIVLTEQTILSVVESGHRNIRDVAQDLERAILNLHNCVQTFFR